MTRTGNERSWRRQRGRRGANGITPKVTFPACTCTPETTRFFFPAFHSSDPVQVVNLCQIQLWQNLLAGFTAGSGLGRAYAATGWCCPIDSHCLTLSQLERWVILGLISDKAVDS